MAEPSVTITARGARRIDAGHPWVYRSDVRNATAAAGDVVRLLNEAGHCLGRAFYSDRSQIAVRLVTREDVPIDHSFLLERIRAAAARREQWVQDTQAYRLVYGEGDLLPSLIVDRYTDFLVIQTLSQGTEKLKSAVVQVLTELFAPKGILERNDPKVRLREALPQTVSVLYGSVPERVETTMNGVLFSMDLLHGQKTGAFLDQRENYAAAAAYAHGQTLDCFTYHGGFALTVAKASESVEAVDLSPQAIEQARENQQLNRIQNVSFRAANAFDLLREFDDAGRRFHTVILDPPAFAKDRPSIAAASRGYKEINLRSLRLLRPGGTLVTCSCSYHLPEHLFLQILAEAAVDAHRQLIIVERRTQARDHPIALSVPETKYLKCLIIKAA